MLSICFVPWFLFGSDVGLLYFCFAAIVFFLWIQLFGAHFVAICFIVFLSVFLSSSFIPLSIKYADHEVYSG
jgi:hypothetical protein